MAFVKELKVLLSHKEVDKNHLWLKPRTDCPGFDLLIYNADGWEPLFLPPNCYVDNIECPVCERDKQLEK